MFWEKFTRQSLLGKVLGTSQSTIWSFDLLYDTDIVSTFNWIDYKGGLLEDISSSTTDKENLLKLLKIILSSHAVMLFADSIIITNYRDVNEARYWSGARQINQIIEAYNRQKPNSTLTLTIVLTKADAVHEQWKANNYAALIHRGLEIFEPIASLCHKNDPNWLGGIVPVSAIGEGKAQTIVTRAETFQEPIKTNTKLLAFPKPLNVDHALFFCIGTILAHMSREAQEKIQNLDQKIKHLQSRSLSLKNLSAIITGDRITSEIADEIILERAKEFTALQVYAPYVKNLYSLSLSGVKRI